MELMEGLTPLLSVYTTPKASLKVSNFLELISNGRKCSQQELKFLNNLRLARIQTLYKISMMAQLRDNCQLCARTRLVLTFAAPHLPMRKYS
jgi:hypothetical protein